MGQPERGGNGRGASRWIAVIAVLLLLAGIGVAVQSRRHPEPAPVATNEATTDADEAAPPSDPQGEPQDEPAIPDDEVHRKALAGKDEKSKWVREVPGLDVSDLSPERHEIFLAAANTQRCTCGCGYTLAGCRVYDSTCEKSGPRVAALLDSVRAGQIRSAAGLRKAPAHPG